MKKIPEWEFHSNFRHNDEAEIFKPNANESINFKSLKWYDRCYGITISIEFVEKYRLDHKYQLVELALTHTAIAINPGAYSVVCALLMCLRVMLSLYFSKPRTK